MIDIVNTATLPKCRRPNFKETVATLHENLRRCASHIFSDAQYLGFMDQYRDMYEESVPHMTEEELRLTFLSHPDNLRRRLNASLRKRRTI